jgi:TolA-binding protein
LLEYDFIPSGIDYGVMRILLLAVGIFCLFCFLAPSRSLAQQPPQYEEVIFGFTLKELGSYNISVAVRNDRIYLPVMELFNIFEVYYTLEGQNIIKGTYLSSAFPMTIDPVRRTITVGDKTYELTKEDVFKGDLDVYLSPEKFEEIFGISSTVNINRLQIISETTRELPALLRKKTAQDRTDIRGGSGVPTKYPLRYDLERSLLGGAVLDYNVTTSLNKFTSQGTSYTFTGGGEVAGGDLQGSLVGATGQSSSLTDTRWRYVVRDNNFFSSLMAGQITTGSDFVPRVTGIALSNEPVEPRIMFDNYVVDGYTEPESDVELYLNDRLIDFQKTNAAGYYRFQFPLTYGTMRIAVKTFSKYGDINVDEKQVQIPFTFVPNGVLSYNLQAGKTNGNVGLPNDLYFGNANLLYGATNWLTLNGGLEQSSKGSLRKPIVDGGLSSRLFSQYIVNMDVAPNAYYRMNANALFASNAGFYIQYAKNVLTDSLIGLSPQQTANLTLFLPLTFVSTGTGFRISEDYTDAVSGKRLSPRLDLLTRLTDVQLLMSYSEVVNGADVRPLNLAGNGLITTTAMYMLPRGSFLPNFLQGFLLRGQAIYDLQAKTYQDASLQFSKTFMQIFQFNLGFERNFAANSTSFQAGLIMDLNVTRTSSVFNESEGSSTQRHSLYGSVAIDHNSGTAFLSNREEIGKGGVDAVLFVDNNDNGVYDAGDELIPAKGVKVDGMGKIELGRDSVIRVSQLQSYFRYNLEVDRQQIDPNLVPTKDKFSFVVDPNQFRRIEIPFYRGGTISGTVYLEKEAERKPLSGTRVIMRSTDGAFGDTLRTFADGGFYVMNVAPGSYTLTVDPTQLQFLQAVQKNGPLSVTVHRSRQGDIIDTLEIVLTRLGPKVNLKAEDDDQILTSTSNDVKTIQPAEKQGGDRLGGVTKTTLPVTPMIEMKQTESMGTAERTEIAKAKYKDAIGALKSSNHAETAALLQKMLDEEVPDGIADHCHYWIGEIKFADQEYEKALQEFHEVLMLDTWEKRGDAWLMVGMCYEKMGNKERAREAFEKVVKDYPMTGNVRKAKEHIAGL